MQQVHRVLTTTTWLAATYISKPKNSNLVLSCFKRTQLGSCILRAHLS